LNGLSIEHNVVVEVVGGGKVVVDVAMVDVVDDDVLAEGAGAGVVVLREGVTTTTGRDVEAVGKDGATAVDVVVTVAGGLDDVPLSLSSQRPKSSSATISVVLTATTRCAVTRHDRPAR